jgi:hypothetical protein
MLAGRRIWTGDLINIVVRALPQKVRSSGNSGTREVPSLPREDTNRVVFLSRAFQSQNLVEPDTDSGDFEGWKLHKCSLKSISQRI